MKNWMLVMLVFFGVALAVSVNEASAGRPSLLSKTTVVNNGASTTIIENPGLLGRILGRPASVTTVNNLGFSAFSQVNPNFFIQAQSLRQPDFLVVNSPIGFQNAGFNSVPENVAIRQGRRRPQQKVVFLQQNVPGCRIRR